MSAFTYGALCWKCRINPSYCTSFTCEDCLVPFRNRMFSAYQKFIDNWSGWFAATRYLDFLLLHILDQNGFDECGSVAYYTTVVYYMKKSAPPFEHMQELMPSMTEEDYTVLQSSITSYHFGGFEFDDVDQEFQRIKDVQCHLPGDSVIYDCDIQQILCSHVYQVHFIKYGILEAIRRIFYALRLAHHNNANGKAECNT